jgi:tripartite-type tricarboxylate transporter receptor subunit TctC
MNKGGDPALVAKIIAALERATANPEYKQKMKDHTLEWYGIFGKDYEKFMFAREQEFLKLLPAMGWN